MQVALGLSVFMWHLEPGAGLSLLCPWEMRGLFPTFPADLPVSFVIQCAAQFLRKDCKYLFMYKKYLPVSVNVEEKR